MSDAIKISRESRQVAERLTTCAAVLSGEVSRSLQIAAVIERLLGDPRRQTDKDLVEHSGKAATALNAARSALITAAAAIKAYDEEVL